MKNLENILADYSQKLMKALDHLDYSYQKVQSIKPQTLDDEALEVWESFSSRFSRCVDLFLTKYLRTRVLMEDPGFAGTLRDCLNMAEKMKIIESADTWMELRELRNMAAHDYNDSDLEDYFNQLLIKTPPLLQIKLLLK